MGAVPSAHSSSPTPIVLPPPCNAECQRKKEINRAKNTYDDDKNDLKNAKKKYRQSWVELNTLENGPKWIENEDKNKNNFGLLNLYENKKKEIEILSKNYNDNLEILYNQILVTNNQYEKISKLDFLLNNNLTNLKKKKHMYSTNLRKLKYEKDKYVSFSNNMSNLSKSFISSLIIYILLLIIYKILVIYEVNIGIITPIEFPKFQNPISKFGKLPGVNRSFLS
jgi:hypothetical protein